MCHGGYNQSHLAATVLFDKQRYQRRFNYKSKICDNPGLTLEQLLIFCSAFSEHPITWSILWRVLVCDVSLGLHARDTAMEKQFIEAALNDIIHSSKMEEFQSRSVLGEPKAG